VLILGASGGVGSFAVLLAKHLFRVPLVLATCSARNAQYVRNLGADAVIDYTSQDVTAAALQHLQEQLQQQPGSNSSSGSSSARTHASSSSRSLDLVIDNVGGIDHMRMACRLLTPSVGLYVTSVPLSNPDKSSPLSVLSLFVHLCARKLLHFLAPGSYPNVAFNGASPDGHMLQGLVDWLAAAETVVHGSSAGQCVVRLTELDLQDTGVALTAVQSKRVVGKLVLKVNPEL
jgi:NADPH:quinone reductase-like Zn-dependent oxidoreductase